MKTKLRQKMFFEEDERVIDFFFNQLVDKIVHKPLGAEE
jgi:hypothetical protein